MTTIHIPPEAVEAARKAFFDDKGMIGAIRAALAAWKPSWTETECDNAGVIVSRVYVLDITPEENPDAEA